MTNISKHTREAAARLNRELAGVSLRIASEMIEPIIQSAIDAALQSAWDSSVSKDLLDVQAERICRYEQIVMRLLDDSCDLDARKTAQAELAQSPTPGQRAKI